ncbi:TonB family protein [Aliiroseovarius sediminis]|uniref:TonB family protein n=1 Tax=Aliiroseovarius sediminis TaxID=2925839 RepID=UPI001F577C3A|nr:TonB family protein [Aliiroseovarius sediminis]MCI2393807.1 TonB family protein [Aliiroseovarius sediminis]
MSAGLREILICFGLAVSGHVVLWPSAPPVGSDAAGADGQAQVALRASDATLEALVARWETTPDVAVATPELAPPMPVEPPVLDTPSNAQAQARMAMPVMPARPDVDRPSADTPPPATSAPEASVKPKPRKPAPAVKRAPQRAVGAGGGQAAGRKAKTDSSAGQGDSQRLLARWGGKVRAAIERRKRYPRGTRAEGTVTLSLTVSPAGQVVSAGVVRSSGHAALDQAALAAIRTARIPPAPKGLGKGPHRFTVPVAFSR